MLILTRYEVSIKFSTSIYEMLTFMVLVWGRAHVWSVSVRATRPAARA